MRLLPIALGLPGTIGFPTAIAHHRSPHGQVTEVSYAGKNIIVYHPSHGNSAPTSQMDCFVDSLLGPPGTPCTLAKSASLSRTCLPDAPAPLLSSRLPAVWDKSSP